MLANFRRFLKSIHFLKAVVIAVSMLVPVVISNLFFDSITAGFSVALGALFCAPSDIPGSFRHKFFGMLGSIFLAFIASLLIGYFSNEIRILIPLMALLIFIFSYISVFGFRASLISLSGLLAIVLSFAHDNSELSVLVHSLLVVLGGFWFLGLTTLVSFMLPKIQTDYLFVEIFKKTSEFLKIRGRLLVEKEQRNELFQQMFKLQTIINGHHEEIREVILSKRLNAGFSNRTRRQQLIFSKLIEIFELAISNPVDYEKFDVVFENHKEKLESFKVLIFEIADQLTHISKVILQEEKLQFNTNTSVLLNEAQVQIDYYRVLVGLPKSREGTILLLNLKAYQEHQVQNLTDIERVLNNYTHNNRIRGIKDAERFITPQDYDLKKLRENFSFKSSIFRHSLRLTIVMLIGLIIGQALDMQKSYWILLTLVVIMRPSYGLTKERSKHRVIGTLIGATIGTAVILITQNTVVYGVLAILSLITGFSLVKLNYRSAAAFITTYVIFMYAFIQPDILSVIKFRVVDTLIGSALAFGANYFLWPTWEAKSIAIFFQNSVESNLKFLKEIDELYHKKGEASTEYRLARKEAFLQVGNLNGAYQRLVQEPKSKQQNLGTIYELVTICNTFLSSLSSLGMFIRNNETTKVPIQFETYVSIILNNLETTLKLLKSEISIVSLPTKEVEKTQRVYDDYFNCLSAKRDKEIEEGKPITNDLKVQLRETKLVSEQVKWLTNLSESLVKKVQLI